MRGEKWLPHSLHAWLLPRSREAWMPSGGVDVGSYLACFDLFWFAFDCLSFSFFSSDTFFALLLVLLMFSLVLNMKCDLEILSFSQFHSVVCFFFFFNFSVFLLFLPSSHNFDYPHFLSTSHLIIFDLSWEVSHISIYTYILIHT